MKREMIWTMPYYELEQLIKDTYGVDWSFCAAEECGNDTEHEFRVNGKFDFDYEAEYVMEFKEGKKIDCAAYLLLNELAMTMKIPKGKYLIRVCW